MDINAILEIVKDYLPSILTVGMLVLTTIAQRTNLFNGLKTIMQKAEELKVAAEFKDVQDKMQTLVITINEQEKQIKELTDALNKITRPNNDGNN